MFTVITLDAGQAERARAEQREQSGTTETIQSKTQWRQ